MQGPLRDAAEEGAGGSGGAGAFDAKAFQTGLMAEVNKAINGAIKNLKTELAPKKADKKTDAEIQAEADPEVEAAAASAEEIARIAASDKGDQKYKALENQKYRALEKRLSEQQKAFDSMKAEADTAKEAARKEKRNAVLTTELGKLGVAPDRMKSALRAVDPDIKFAEDGSLVGDDDSPYTDYLKTWLADNEHFLPAKQVGGAGATPGGRRVQAIDLDDIKVGMKPEDLARARAEIANVLQGGR